MRQFLFANNSFLIIITIILFSFSGCEKDYNTFIDSTGSAPALSEPNFSISVVNTDTINIKGQPVRSPDDILTIGGVAKARVVSVGGEKEISAVGCSITNSSFLLAESLLHDDGIFPDATANDSVFSGYIEFQIQRVVVGTFSINLWSESTSRYKSNTIILPLQIVRINHPPILANLVMDSLISIKAITQKYFQIVIQATDPDGQSDVRMVYFNSYKPDGSPSSGNPFYLYDNGDINGISGDYMAGDGYYSLRTGIPTYTGTYRFEFHAVDRSNDTSNTIIKKIVVTN